MLLGTLLLLPFGVLYLLLGRRIDRMNRVDDVVQIGDEASARQIALTILRLIEHGETVTLRVNGRKVFIRQHPSKSDMFEIHEAEADGEFLIKSLLDLLGVDEAYLSALLHVSPLVLRTWRLLERPELEASEKSCRLVCLEKVVREIYELAPELDREKVRAVLHHSRVPFEGDLATLLSVVNHRPRTDQREALTRAAVLDFRERFLK